MKGRIDSSCSNRDVMLGHSPPGKRGKDFIITRQQKESKLWPKGNMAVAVSQGVPQPEIDGVSNDELAT